MENFIITGEGSAFSVKTLSCNDMVSSFNLRNIILSEGVCVVFSLFSIYDYEPVTKGAPA